MLNNLFRNRILHPQRHRFEGIFVILMMLIFFQENALAVTAMQKTFKSPEAAVSALVQAVKANNTKQLISILGQGSEVFILSGDRVQDQEHRNIFSQAFEEKNCLESSEEGQIRLIIGKDDWSFPFPIVKTRNKWRFDTETGAGEILRRHIVKNELNVIQVCLAIADAQKDYVDLMDEETGQPEYARKFKSSKGKKDGLYWDAPPDSEPSPLGSLVAEAWAEGYTRGIGRSTPYHGYLYKILTTQGASANGGAYSYIFDGKMIGGFAVLAFPALYGSSGIHTFIFNHEGLLYKKDLGKNTVRIASAITIFNPDKTWKPVEYR